MHGDMQVPKRKSQMFRKYGGQEDNYLSAAAIRRLKDDLEHLSSTERPKALDDLVRAREMGDLSENAAYSEAKGRLARIDGRIFSLKERLKHAVVIESGADEDGSVRIGSTVVVRAGDTEKTYEITGSQETSPGRGRISHLSPLGALLIGKKSGDNVTLTVNGKGTTYTIVDVR